MFKGHFDQHSPLQNIDAALNYINTVGAGPEGVINRGKSQGCAVAGATGMRGRGDTVMQRGSRGGFKSFTIWRQTDEGGFFQLPFSSLPLFQST